MVELKLRQRTVDLPYTVRVYGVTKEMFDELVDEDTKAELLDGVMIVHSPGSLRHSDIAGFLHVMIRGYAATKRLGNVLGPMSLIRPAAGRRFAPDLYFLEHQRVPRPLPHGYIEGAPDLVLQVLSPSTRKVDLEEKRPAYRQAVVSEVWLVDPEEQLIQVDRRRNKSYATETVSIGRVTSAVMPGFWV